MKSKIKYLVALAVMFVVVLAFPLIASAEGFDDFEQPQEWEDTAATELSEVDGNKYYYPVNANAKELSVNDDSKPEGFTVEFDRDYEEGHYYSFYTTDMRGERNIYAVCDGDIAIENGWFTIENDDYIFIYRFNVGVDDDAYEVTTDDVVVGGQKIATINFTADKNYCWFAIVDKYEETLCDWTTVFGENAKSFEDEFLEELEKYDWEGLSGEVNSRKTWIEKIKTLVDTFLSLGDLNTSLINKLYQKIANGILDTTYDLWNDVGDKLKQADDISAQKKMLNKFILFFQPTVFVFALMFWLYDILCRIMDYREDFATKKTVISMITSLVLAYIFMTKCFVFNNLILQFNNSLVAKIIGSTSWNRAYIDVSLSSKVVEDADFLWAVKPVVYSFVAFSKMAFVFFVAVACDVIALIIFLKLFVRQLEIMAMTIVAPIFYSAWVGERTRHFFAYYIKTFIMVVTQTLYMAVIFVLGRMMFNNVVPPSGTMHIDFDDYEGLKFLFIWIAVGVMMWKPPRSIKDIFGIN